MKLDAGIYEFMKAFRDDRLAKMDSGDIPVSLAEGPTTVLHVLPASAFDPGASVNLSTVAHERSLAGIAGVPFLRLRRSSRVGLERLGGHALLCSGLPQRGSGDGRHGTAGARR
jgi:hypothetical protein